MIDMSALYTHSDYQTALDSFALSNCKWKHFKDVHLKVSRNRCPICECLLDESVTRETKDGGTTTIKATIDHYRPQEHYEFLKCNHKNYLLMCSECNSMYKKSDFPLHSSTPIRATDEVEVANEKPLIVNPITDNLLELFNLVFTKTRNSQKEVLELKPKVKDKSDYLYEKALETVKLFGLYDCENNRHENENVHNCRIDMLMTHFSYFVELARAKNRSEKEFIFVVYKRYKEENKDISPKEFASKFKNNREEFIYGFAKFIDENQFEIL